MIIEIAKFILAMIGTGGPWILGDNYFVGAVPPKSHVTGLKLADRIACILERSPADLVGDLPDFRAKHIQVWNRNIDYLSAREDAEQIFGVLHGATGWDLPIEISGVQYYAWTIDAISDPAPIYNPDDIRRFEFSTNFVFRVSLP